MGVFKTADGRSLVGIGQQDGNEYSGFAGWRDCVIQLTASGATEDSVKYLNAIKEYAIAHNAKGESIMPPNLSIWISNNGVTTAVQADDIAVDGANVTICGIKWNGTAWDYTDAGKGGGGSGSGGGSQEPITLRCKPESDSNIFRGTVTGATKAEVVSAWANGTQIKANYLGIELTPTVAITIQSNDPKLAFLALYTVSNVTSLMYVTIYLKNMNYIAIAFSGLTPITD